MGLQTVRAVLVLSVWAIGCGDRAEIPTSPGGPPPDPSATFSRVQNEIFTPSCTAAGCHGNIAPQQGLVLTPGVAYGLTVGVASTEQPSLMRIAPGAPLESYLYRKVTGGAITGDRMPLGGPYLSDERTALLRDWIRRGAPND